MEERGAKNTDDKNKLDTRTKPLLQCFPAVQILREVGAGQVVSTGVAGIRELCYRSGQ